MNPSSAVPRPLHPLVHGEPMVDLSWDLSFPTAGAEAAPWVPLWQHSRQAALANGCFSLRLIFLGGDFSFSSEICQENEINVRDGRDQIVFCLNGFFPA